MVVGSLPFVGPVMSFGEFASNPTPEGFVGLAVSAIPGGKIAKGLASLGKSGKAAKAAVNVAEDCPDSLYHYTSGKGLKGITDMEALKVSKPIVGKKNAVDGAGIYLTSLAPSAGLTPGQLSRRFKKTPSFWGQFTHYVEVDVTGLGARVSKEGKGAFFIPSEEEFFNIAGRILSSGKVQR